MRRYVRNFLFALLVLIFYFVIFINFAPTIVSFIEAFVEANHEIFVISFAVKEFTVTEEEVMYGPGGEPLVQKVVVPVDKYVSIDLSILLKFLANFAIYVLIPLSVLFVMVRR